VSDYLFIAGVLSVFIFAVIAAVFAFSGFVFAVAWNFLVPLFWHAAPHLTWLHGVAAGFVLGILRGLVTVSVKREG